jgi:hypothetical protein
LTSWASNLIIHGASDSEIELSLYDQPAFQARFPAIEARRKAGMSPISITDYLNYESTVRQMAGVIGMPLSQSEIDQLLINDVSAQEVDQRIQIASEAALSDNETRTFLQANYSITPGQISKYWMDPKKELPILQQQFRIGQIGGAAVRTGFGGVTLSQAQRLASTGMDQAAAESAFKNLAHISPLFTPISTTEDTFSTDEQIALAVGDQDVEKLLEHQQQGRQAEFKGGGGYAAGKEGFATGTAK